MSTEQKVTAAQQQSAATFMVVCVRTLVDTLTKSKFTVEVPSEYLSTTSKDWYYLGSNITEVAKWLAAAGFTFSQRTALTRVEKPSTDDPRFNDMYARKYIIGYRVQTFNSFDLIPDAAKIMKASSCNIGREVVVDVKQTIKNLQKAGVKIEGDAEHLPSSLKSTTTRMLEDIDVAVDKLKFVVPVGTNQYGRVVDEFDSFSRINFATTNESAESFIAFTHVEPALGQVVRLE